MCRNGRRRRKHRYVLELLEGKDGAKAVYIDMVRTLAVDRAKLTENDWRDGWRPALMLMAQEMIGATVASDDVAAFLAWGDVPSCAEGEDRLNRSDNIFRYPLENPAVAVRVGSIHAVKGETHTATLLLETYYKDHHLKVLKPWLLGDRVGADGASRTVLARLRLHYVAMTRPARLLCLALRQDSMKDEEITRLRQRGWRVARVKTDRPEWID